MKSEKLFELIGTANESFVAEAAEYPQRANSVGWFVRFAAVASLVLVIGASAWFLRNMNDDDSGLITGDTGQSTFMPGVLPGSDVIVADFLMQFTSLFSFGISVGDGYITRMMGDTIESPRVRWDGYAFTDAYGEVLENYAHDLLRGIGVPHPFIWEGRVAMYFQLNDLGVGVPVITIMYEEYEPGSAMPTRTDNPIDFIMFQYVNGEFIAIRKDRSLHYPPSFFRDDTGRLILITRQIVDDEFVSEFFHATLENGVLITTEIPGNFYELSHTSLYRLEAEIREMMRSHFGHEHIPNHARLPRRDELQIQTDDQLSHMAHQERVIAEVRELIPAFNQLMSIYRFGLDLDPDRIVRDPSGRTYMAVNDPNFQTMQDLSDLRNQAFWFWDDAPESSLWSGQHDPGMPPVGISPSGSITTTELFFREFGGQLYQLVNNFAIFEYEGSLLFPTITNGSNAHIEYVWTTQDSVVVRVNVSVEYEFPGANLWIVEHTMLLELSAVFADGNLRRISLMTIEPAREPIGFISEMAEWHRGAVTGAIVIYDDMLFIDPVEVVWVNDRAAMHAHGLTLEDFTHGYHLIHSDEPQTMRFAITPDTVFSFIDTVGVLGEENRGQMVETTNVNYFRRQVSWGLRDLPHEFDPNLIGTPTQRRIIYFIHTDGDAVTRVIQEFIFTQ